jgi:hypothetical protein
MNMTATIAKIGHNAQSSIDVLGSLNAQIAELEAQAKPLKADIIAMGPGRHEGRLFAASVSEIAPSESPDASDMEKKLREMGVNDNWFRHHMKTRAGYSRVRVEDR